MFVEFVRLQHSSQCTKSSKIVLKFENKVQKMFSKRNPETKMTHGKKSKSPDEEITYLEKDYTGNKGRKSGNTQSKRQNSPELELREDEEQP